MPKPPRIDPRREPTLRKGPVRYSKRVLDRIKATHHLLGSIRSLKEQAAAGFSERFAGELRDGETVPDQTLALELTARSVETAMDLLSDADHAYCRQGVHRRILRDACYAVALDEVYPEVVDVRRSITSRFGADAARSVHGMEGKTRRKPKALLPQVEYLVVTLRDPKRRLPPPRRTGAVVDREGWLRRVEPGYDKLKTMLKDLKHSELREAWLRDERDYELEWFDVVYAEALAFVRGVYLLAGLGEKRIWNLLPTVQKRHLKAKARGEREARADGRRPRKKAAGDVEGAGGRASEAGEVDGKLRKGSA